MFNSVPHSYLQYANQTLNWLDQDSEKVYLDNLQNKRASLEKLNWVDANITYTFNSYGFRSDEFSLDPGVMFLGCSHTAGVGLPLESTWPYLVSSQLGLKRFNLGISSTSNDTAFRLGHNWIPQLKPKLVILLAPDSNRSELHSYIDVIENLGAWTDYYGNYWKQWQTHKTNTDMNFLKNILATKQICSEHSIKFLHLDIENFRFVTDERARDLLHFGTANHKEIADHFLSLAES